MNLPPALMAFLLPAGLFTAWLFLHKDADVEQRIDKREAVHKMESAKFDKDFSRLTGDKDGEEEAKKTYTDAEKELKIADDAKKQRLESDKRNSVRDGIDEFLTPKDGQKK